MLKINYLKNAINKFLTNTSYTFISKDVADFVNYELSESYPEYFIRNFMKNKIKSFKQNSKTQTK